MIKVFKLIATVLIFSLLARMTSEMQHVDGGLLSCVILSFIASVMGAFDIFINGVLADH